MPLQHTRIFRFDVYELKIRSRTLERRGSPVALGSKAFEVLTCLVVKAGEVVSKAELLQHVWPESHVEEGTLSQHIFALRKALGKDAAYIVTVPGRGYQFTAAVQELPGDTSLPTQADDELPQQQFHERTHIVIEETSSTAEVRSRQISVPASVASVVVALAALALAGWEAWHWMYHTQGREFQKVVVADIINTTGEATFDNTLKRALQIDLEQSPYMDVLSEHEAASTLQLMGRKADAPLQGDTAREVCERSNHQVLLTGSVSTVGKEYLLTLEALDCASGKKLGAAKARANSEEAVFSALDRVTDKVREQLGESAKSVQSFQVPIAEATTPSLEALKAYSIGTMMEAQGKTETEILPLLQRAVTLDPNFAMAYSSMGTQYYNLSEFKLASQAYSKAFALSGRVSAREKLAIEAHYYAEGQQDLEQGIRVYKTWAATYPNDWIPWNHLADEYTRTGQYEAAIEAGQRALALEPDRAINYSVLMRAYKRAGRYDEAKALAETAIRRGKGSSGVHGLLYVIAWQQHDIEALSREAKFGEDEGWYGFYLEALAAAAEGRYKSCSALFQHAAQLANEDNVGENADGMLTDEAIIELLFGLKSEAQQTLTRIGKADRDMEELVKVRAMMGDEAPAEAFLRAHQDQPGTGTILTYLKLPQLRAQLALQHRTPEAAVAALESAKPYEMAGYDIPSLRGEAYLQAHQPELAAAEYRKVLDNPGISFGPLYPMAHLGLARAYGALGRVSDSRAEYLSFLAAWKDADPDLPLLHAAKAELAQLH